MPSSLYVCFLPEFVVYFGLWIPEQVIHVFFPQSTIKSESKGQAAYEDVVQDDENAVQDGDVVQDDDENAVQDDNEGAENDYEDAAVLISQSFH